MKYPEALNPQTMQPVRILHANKLPADLQLKAVSSARMELPIDDTINFGEWVKIYYPNGKFGIFRSSIPETDYKAGKITVTLDHGVCTLGDSIVNVGDTKDENDISQPTYFEGTPTQVFTRLLTYQKKTYWQLGTCEATDAMKVEIDYPNLLTVMNDSMTQLPDYYLEYDQTSFPWTVNIRRFPTTVKSEGRLSRNVNSAVIRYDENELYTRVYCEALTNKYLDSEKINDYPDVREYHYYLSDDVDNASATKICRQFLKEHEVPKITAEIDGADFSGITGQPLDKVILGDMYRLAIAERNLVVEEQITRIRYTDLINREREASITLARDRENLSSLLAKTANKVQKNSNASSKSRGTVSHVYEKLVKTATELTDHGEVLKAAGLEFDENHVLIFATEEGKESQIGAYFKVQKDNITSTVEAKDKALEDSLKSTITQTATEIRQEVSNDFTDVRSSITTQANRISLVVEGTGSNAHVKPSAIEAAITDTNGYLSSTIKLSADKLYLDGDTTMDGVLEVQNGIGYFPNGVIIGQNTLIGKTTGIISSEFKVRYGGTGSTRTFNVVDVQKSGNNLVITYVDGNTETFSKAVTSATWTWSNGRAKVDLSPQGQSYYSPSIDSWTVRGNPSVNGSTVSQDINIVDEDGNTVTILNVSVNASGVVNPISIPTSHIYTTSGSAPSGSTNATTLQQRIQQAIRDNDTVVFRVDCGGTQKYYHMSF